MKHPKIFLKVVNHDEDDDDDNGKLPKECLLIGNAVDCLITEPQLFNEKFKICDDVIISPSGMYKTFVDSLFLTRKDIDREVDSITEDQWYENAFAKVKTKQFTLEGFKEKFTNQEGAEYYNYLIECQIKQILTVEQYDKVQKIIESLKEHVFTKGYFNLNKDQEIIYQLEIGWTYDGVDLKSKLDMVIIDHRKKTISPFDLKTTENNHLDKFQDTFWRNRYDFQGAAYLEAIKQWAEEKFPDYLIEPFVFIVESTKYIGSPLIYKLSPESETIGWRGGYHQNKRYYGFTEAIEMYKFHTDNNLWEYRMIEYLSNGIIEI